MQVTAGNAGAMCASAPRLAKFRDARRVFADERLGQADDVDDGEPVHAGSSARDPILFATRAAWRSAQFVNGLDDFGQIHFVDFDAPADFAAASVMVNSPPRCSRNSFKPREHLQIAVGGDVQQFVGEKFEAELFQQRKDALGGFGVEQTDVARINHVQRDADGDGFAVADLEIGKLLQLVRRPMAEIQRTRRAELKRVAARGDVIEVQFGAAVDQPLHRRRFERSQFFRVAFDFVEKFRVADAGDFHGLDVAGAFVARFERGEQVEIVDDGEAAARTCR